MLNRKSKILIQILLDIFLISASYIIAMQLFHGNTAGTILEFNWKPLFSTILITIIVFQVLGLYKVVVRFITSSIISIIGMGSLVAGFSVHVSSSVFDVGFPLAVSIIFTMVLLLSISVSRLVTRNYFRNLSFKQKQKVLIYGAGSAGQQLMNALFFGNDYNPIALIDDDPTKCNLSIGGLNVYSPNELPNLVQKTGVKIILIAIPSLSRKQLLDIIELLKDLNLTIKTVPSLTEIVSRKAKISDLYSLSPNDFLGRDPVSTNLKLLGKNINKNTVMVTGAGGSIGSALCKEILEQKPKILVLYEKSELALYNTINELTEIANNLKVKTVLMPILGCVLNEKKIETVIKDYNIQTIYHAAAYKHVPIIEENIVSGVENNVFGTFKIVMVAHKQKVKNFVLVSTDKAVRPTSIMGATKRIAELICQSYAHKKSSTIFTIVRFGNVLGSSGSVIPRFQYQIDLGGPITVTHREVTRYFMTITEAAQLLLQAGSISEGGDIFILDMGKPIKILNLAINMAKLQGLTPYVVDNLDHISSEKGDIPIYITGLRKGEKLHEELLIKNQPLSTKHPKIMTAIEEGLPQSELWEAIDLLQQACETSNLDSINAIFQELPIQYKSVFSDN